MIKRILSTALFVLATSATMLSQNVALKTNALYWATTTPNLGIEASVGKKSTLQLFYGLNIIAKTKRAEIENEMSKTSLFSLPFFSCIYWGLNNN